MPAQPVLRDSFSRPGWPIAVGRKTLPQSATAGRVPVTHGYAALAFYLGGQARIEQGASWKVEPGDVLLVPAGQPHRLLKAESSEYWGLAFCVSCCVALGEARLLDSFERVRDGASAVVHIPRERQAFLSSLFGELHALSQRPGANSEFSAVQRSLLTLILHEVDSAAGQHARATVGPSGIVTASLRFIERNALRPLTLGDVAKAVGRSPAHVTTALSRATGRSAVGWIVSARMAEARRLLLHSDERVDRIAERVGYADATHFIRMFRRNHGATPAAWRSAESAAWQSEQASNRELPSELVIDHGGGLDAERSCHRR